MPALPICPDRVSGKGPLTSFAEYGFRVHVEETSSVFLADGRFSN
jgi:hypothetical protein